MSRRPRPQVTRASRMMLPGHAVFSLYIGAVWALQDPGRTSYPPYVVLTSYWPIWGSGVVVACAGLALAAAQLLRRRHLISWALAFGVVVYAVLAIPFGLSIWRGASYGAPAWPLYAAWAHLASMVSVVFEEGMPPFIERLLRGGEDE